MEINGWGKVLAGVLTGAVGVAGFLGAPSVLIFNELRATTSRNSERLGEVEQKQITDHGFQAVAAVQQWCDAVVRELEREQANHRDYFLQACPNVSPPVSHYIPPAPPWGAAAIK